MLKKELELSIISPIYLAENIVDDLVKQIKENVLCITKNFEIILIDDGSHDNSWLKIEENCKKDHRIKGIRLSKNFGQHYAISAGLKKCFGNYAIVMDCDLQHDPIYIKDLINKAEEGFDIVLTKEINTEKSLLRKISSKIFYFIYNLFTSSDELDAKVGNFSILNHKVIEAFNSTQEYHRHYLMLLKSLGFHSTNIKINHKKRYEGKSSYGFITLIKLAIDGIISNSDTLLRKTITLGFIYVLFALAYSFYALFTYFYQGSYPGFTSIIIILLSSTGIILSSLGIIGIYIGKIFIQVKKRPLYIIDTMINIDA